MLLPIDATQYYQEETSLGPRQLSRYSDSLQAGPSVDRIPVLKRFSAPIQTCSEAHPASCTMDTGSLPGVKRPGRGVHHPPHLAPRLKKELSYTSTPPLGLRGMLQGDLYLQLLESVVKYIRNERHQTCCKQKQKGYSGFCFIFQHPTSFDQGCKQACS